MKATARWPRVARENAITALRCAVASWFALWWLNAGIGGRHNVPDNLPVGFLAVSIIVLSRDANSLGAWLLLGAVMGISLGIATPLSYGVIIFLRGQDQISRKHFDVALPLTMFRGARGLRGLPRRAFHECGRRVGRLLRRDRAKVLLGRGGLGTYGRARGDRTRLRPPRRGGVARGQRGLRVEGMRAEHLGRLSSLPLPR